jgi:formylglycine-generating enzyme required for sulfatase activity
MGRFEVTQAEWQSVMGSNPSFCVARNGFPGSDNRPVEWVSWDDITGFRAATGLRLPTEAEWEYAYRAGTRTAFHGWRAMPTGSDDDSLVSEIAWMSLLSGTQVVGQKAANGFGLHDMAGNVFEWVNDFFGYYLPLNLTDPSGPSSGTAHVVRGGRWFEGSGSCRSSWRDDRPSNRRNEGIGFRVVRDP